MTQVQEKPREDTFDHLPAGLLETLRGQIAMDSVQAVAALDLDDRGQYREGYLVLTADRLGHFQPTNGHWEGGWRKLGEIGSAAIIEGLGMSLLRLSKDGSALAEHRFTLRHAKSVAKLHRRLERQIEGKGDEELPPELPKGDDKKVRCDKCGKVIPPWSEVCPSCLCRRKVLSRLMDFVKPYKYRAAVGFLLSLSVTACMLVRTALNKPMFDKGIGAVPGQQPDYGLLLTYILIMGGLMIFGAVAGAMKERLMAKLASRMGRDIRDQTYAHLHKLSLSFFAKKPTGSLVTRITSDSDRIWDFVAFTAIESANSFLMLVGICVGMFLTSWKLAMIVLIPIPIMLVLTLYFHHKLHRGFDRLFHKWSTLTSVVADALPGVRVIKAFSQEKREVNRFGDKNREYFEDEIGMISIWTMFGPVVAFCTQIAWLLVWVVGGYWVVRDWSLPAGTPDRMTAGSLIVFQGYMWMFFGPIHMIAHMDRMLNRAATSVQRIFEILDTEPVIYSKTEARQPEELQGQIELRDVSFSYDGVRKVLKNVSLTIKPGEMIGLAGPSGGGKSTLINLVCRFYDVLEGQILIDGVDVRDYDVEAMRRRIGVVLQEPFLFHGTIARNIAYGNPDATIEQIIAAARAANAHDFIVGFPDGYDAMVGERGQTLSGGERQRISIARAILNNPKILILDEATSSVDTETEKLIQEALDHLIANRTTIAIAHRLSTLRKADRLVILDKGQIVEQGTHDELKDKPEGTYAKLIHMQSEMQSIMAIA